MDGDQKTSEQLNRELKALSQCPAALQAETQRARWYSLAGSHCILRALMDSGDAVDPAGRMTSVNLAFEPPSGYAEREVIGQPSSMLDTPAKDDRHHYSHGDTDHA